MHGLAEQAIHILLPAVGWFVSVHKSEGSTDTHNKAERV
jgi:hypothetical protein